MTDDRPVVLVVEDERDLADLYATWLADDYEVRTAYDGEAAVEQADESVDAVLLDRRLPDTSGDEVLAAIRDRSVDCRVAMVTAVAPDFDVVDMAFDTYVVKPVTADDLRQTVATLLERSTYDETARRYYALASKRAVLEAEKSEAELAESERFQELEAELEAVRADLDEMVDAFDEDDVVAAFRDIGPHGDGAGVDADE